MNLKQSVPGEQLNKAIKVFNVWENTLKDLLKKIAEEKYTNQPQAPASFDLALENLGLEKHQIYYGNLTKSEKTQI